MSKAKVTSKEISKEVIEKKVSELVSKDSKLKAIQDNFKELTENGFFRINGKNELMSSDELIINSYYKKLIANKIKENSDPATEQSQIEANIKLIESYKKELNELVKLDEAKSNVKSELSNMDKDLFFSMDGKELLLTSCNVVNNKIDNNSIIKNTVPNLTNTIEKLSHFKATKALKTAFSDASDYKFYKLEIIDGNLLLTLTDCKNMKERFYGILGTVEKKAK